MLLKIFTAKRETPDYGDTGTYADGYLTPETEGAAKREDKRSSYERDYGRGRTLENIPLGFA